MNQTLILLPADRRRSEKTLLLTGLCFLCSFLWRCDRLAVTNNTLYCAIQARCINVAIRRKGEEWEKQVMNVPLVQVCENFFLISCAVWNWKYPRFKLCQCLQRFPLKNTKTGEVLVTHTWSCCWLVWQVFFLTVFPPMPAFHTLLTRYNQQLWGVCVCGEVG